jgi:hypothetical protein
LSHQGGGGFKQFPLHASFPELVNKQGHAPSNKPTRLPPTRKEAELLAKLVEETLPPGMVTMKVQQSMFDVESADGVNLVDLTMLEHDFSLIDSVQHAAAEQECPLFEFISRLRAVTGFTFPSIYLYNYFLKN